MLLPEPRLDALVDQLKALPRADRNAILARLEPHEQVAVRAHLRGAAPDRPRSPYSADIAARIDAGDAAPLTGAGRAALARAAGAAAPAPAGSLFDAVRKLWSGA